jgi:hypothetical protein
MKRPPVWSIPLVAFIWFFAGRATAATLWLTEFTDYSPVIFQAAKGPSNRNQTVAIGATSVQSTAVKSNTRLVRLHCDIPCHVEIGGANPTATTSSPRMVGGQTEYFYVAAGAKVAVLLATP